MLSRVLYVFDAFKQLSVKNQMKICLKIRFHSYVPAPAACVCWNAVHRHWCLICISHSSEKAKTSGLLFSCLRSLPKHLLHVSVSQVTEISMGEFLMHSSVVWLNPHPSLGRMRKDPEMTVFGETATPLLPPLLLHCGNMYIYFPSHPSRGFLATEIGSYC